MSVKRLAVITGLLLTGLVSQSQAQQPAQGSIRFQGSIVEHSCDTSAKQGAMLALSHCPLASRGSLIDIQSVQPLGSVEALPGSRTDMRLIADSTNGRTYDQSYQLVDHSGQPIRTGLYLVTLTSP